MLESLVATRRALKEGHARRGLGGVPVPSRDEERAGLTVREYVVLFAAATGLGVAETARELGTSPDVVREALAAAITKLGARSKLEAVLIAARRGLLNLPL
jgi:DNA-binding CsgD family transcriptional regulator